MSLLLWIGAFVVSAVIGAGVVAYKQRKAKPDRALR